jgi:molecular chaperone Hsp33
MSWEEDPEGCTAVECRFLRGRNVLLVSGDFGPVFMDCYLHLGQLGLALIAGADERLKLTVAALALHAAARPRAETAAWTLHFEEEQLNVFAVAENSTGSVTGQVFTKNVKACGHNVLHAEAADAFGVRRRSVVDFEGGSVLGAAEQFYRQSEQREARFFGLGGDVFAALVAQPDADLAWLASARADEVRALAGDRSRPPMETRLFRFRCGCSPERVAGAIWPAVRADIDGLLGGEGHVNVACPRCGLRHEISRELFDGFPR